MNQIEGLIRKIDAIQQRSNRLGFIFGVIKKFGDDLGGSLAGLITFFGFTSMFPLLLLAITLLGILLGNNSSLTHSILNSAFAQFPVLGSQLGNNIHAVHRKSPLALIVGIVGLLLGSQGASQSSQYAMAQVWNIPMTNRPNYLSKLKRTGLLFVSLGVFFVVGAALSAFSSAAGSGALLKIGAIIVSLAANLILYLIAFRILTPRVIATNRLIWGSIVGGIAWTLVQLLGGYLVSHELKNASEVYGLFAIVLGLLSWIYLGARILVYSAEINVVLSRHLWPRSIVQPPLTPADREVLTALGREQDRSQGEEIAVKFTGENLDRDTK